MKYLVHGTIRPVTSLGIYFPSNWEEIEAKDAQEARFKFIDLVHSRVPEYEVHQVWAYIKKEEN